MIIVNVETYFQQKTSVIGINVFCFVYKMDNICVVQTFWR